MNATRAGNNAPVDVACLQNDMLILLFCSADVDGHCGSDVTLLKSFTAALRSKNISVVVYLDSQTMSRLFALQNLRRTI